MDFTLFFAWQSDSPLDGNKHLIRDAAKEAVKRIAGDAEVEESPRLDHDTKDLSGTPEVANAIFSKIERAGMFLADVTFVGSSRSADGREKKLPNMNVAIELGYAGKAVGWERVILVMNKAYGQPDEQVFDIKHRRNPICYDVPAGSSKEKAKEEKAKLSKAIEEAVRVRLKCEHQAVDDVVKRLDLNCIALIHSAGTMPRFHVPRPGTVTLGSSTGIDSLVLAQAVPRLLDLNVIACFFNEAGSSFGYEWTYFGKRVIHKLGMQPTAMPGERGWPPDYFEKTFGAIDDETFVRPPQGELPKPVAFD